MWFFKSTQEQKREELRDQQRSQKLLSGQATLLLAATSTADVASDVTTMLKSRLDDTLQQIEITAHLLSDALISCRCDGIIDTVNSSAERIFGWHKDRLKGRDISSLFRDNQGLRLSTEQIMHQFFSNKSDNWGMGLTLDHIKGKRRNGELFWVEVNISQVSRTDGSTIIIMLCRDATSRMEIQEALQLNESRFRNIFEASLDGIFVTCNHHITTANPAISKMLGYSLESMIAQPLLDFISEEFHGVVISLHNQRMYGELAARQYVIKMKKSDGNTIDVLVSGTGMQWDNGKHASLMMIKNISDIQ